MKETTKSKLKKVAFGVSLGFNALMLLLLGVGLSRCDAPKTPVEASSSVSVKANARFLDPSANRASTLDFDGVPDLMEDATITIGRGFRFETVGGSYSWTLYDDMYRSVGAIYLPAGVYWLVSRYASVGYSPYLYDVDAATAEDMNERLSDGINGSFAFASYPSVKYSTYEPSFNGVFMQSSGGWFFVSCNRFEMPSVYLADLAEVDPSAKISFPSNYNPMVMFAHPEVGSIYAVYAPANIINNVDFDIVVRIAGNTYTRVRYVIARMDLFNYVDSQGEEHILASGNTWGAWGASHAFVTEVKAYSPNGEYITLWQADYYSKVVGTGHEFVWALNRDGSWATPEFRSWEVLGYVGDTSQYPSARFPDYDAVQLLSVRSDAVTGSLYVGGNDVFSLLAGGFNAWTGIFSVQLLPSLTIGALLFVPLVVVIIWALVRLLAK